MPFIELPLADLLVVAEQQVHGTTGCCRLILLPAGRRTPHQMLGALITYSSFITTLPLAILRAAGRTPRASDTACIKRTPLS